MANDPSAAVDEGVHAPLHIGEDAAVTDDALGEQLKASPVRIYVAFVLATCGVGVLSLPHAMHQGSFVPALFVFTVMPVISAFTAHALGLAAGLMPSAQYSTVVCHAIFDAPAIAGDAGPDGSPATKMTRRRRGIFAAILDVTTSLLTCTFGVALLRTSLDSWVRVLSAAGVEDGPLVHRPLYVALSFLLFTPLVAQRALKDLFVITVLGVITIVAFVGAMVIAYAETGGHGYSSELERADVRWFELRASFMGLPTTALAAICVHELIPQMYFEMARATPPRFRRVVISGTFTCFLLYTASGVAGYLTFGSAVANPIADGSVLNNYPSTALWTVFRALVLAHVLCAIPIFGLFTRLTLYRVYVAYQSRDGDGDPAAGYKLDWRWRTLHSVVTMAAFCLIAWLAPSVGAVVSFAGAFFGVLISLVVPAIVGAVIWSGAWAGTAEARASGSAELYEPWAFGRAASLAAAVLGALMIVLSVLTAVGVFDEGPGAGKAQNPV